MRSIRSATAVYTRTRALPSSTLLPRTRSLGGFPARLVATRIAPSKAVRLLPVATGLSARRWVATAAGVDADVSASMARADDPRMAALFTSDPAAAVVAGKRVVSLIYFPFDEGTRRNGGRVRSLMLMITPSCPRAPWTTRTHAHAHTLAHLHAYTHGTRHAARGG